MAQRTRPRITVTVDPDMLEEIDAYVHGHEGMDRSHVVGEALRCWYAQAIHEELVKQHSAQKPPEEQEEREAWRHIRGAQTLRLSEKYQRQREE